MKQLLLAMFFLLSCVKVVADEKQTALVVWAKDGTKLI